MPCPIGVLTEVASHRTAIDRLDNSDTHTHSSGGSRGNKGSGFRIDGSTEATGNCQQGRQGRARERHGPRMDARGSSRSGAQERHPVGRLGKRSRGGPSGSLINSRCPVDPWRCRQHGCAPRAHFFWPAAEQSCCRRMSRIDRRLPGTRSLTVLPSLPPAFLIRGRDDWQSYHSAARRIDQ